MRSMPYWRTCAQRSWNSGLLVSTLLCGGGAAGFERRSGGCCVSHGTWLFSGGRRAGPRRVAAGVRRAPRRPARVDAEDGQRGGAEHARVELHEVGAAGGQDAEPLAVGVTRAAIAGEARERRGQGGGEGAGGRGRVG